MKRRVGVALDLIIFFARNGRVKHCDNGPSFYLQWAGFFVRMETNGEEKEHVCEIVITVWGMER